MKLTEFRKFHIATAAGLLLTATLILGGQSHSPVVSKQAKDTVKEKSTNPERYLTHVTTDKPIYRPGENVYLRGVLLSANGHTPRPDTDSTVLVRVEIKGPKGDVVVSRNAAIVDSTVGFTWGIPAGQAGGEYTARILHPGTGDAPAERKFDIRGFRAVRLKSQIVFLRDGYGPGDTVTARLHVERAEGGFPTGAKVSVSARVDGEEAWKSETLVDAAGYAGTTFKLPASIARGEGTLAMTIEDGGTVETATKTLPLLTDSLDLSIYPEGGDLVAGLVNRVYVEGRTPAKKPADMAGVVLNGAGREVGAFRTEHEGRGRFSFTPEKGQTYSLRITEPAGIKSDFPLPQVKESGVVLTSTSDITPRLNDVVLGVASNVGGIYRIALGQHGKEFASMFVTLEAGASSPVTIPVPSAPQAPDGVIVATVYDAQQTPLAERLLFLQPVRGLKVQVTADKTDFLPGAKVSLRVSTTDDGGKPVAAVVGLTVTDSSVLEMIDKREQAPRLPVMVLLENDVKDLSDAHVYLDETDPRAPLATDLLLGTQGWPRFATADTAKFVTANGDAARRALSIVPLSNGPFPEGLPLYGNDPLTLITTLPGYRANPMGHEFDTIGGLPLTMINTVRDGLSVTDGFNPGGVGSNTIMNPDMISEIRLILSPVDAEVGRGNGQVQITTKSGVNRFLWGIAAAFTVGTMSSGPMLDRNSWNDAFVIFGDPSNKPKPVMREYAHRRPTGWTEGSRSDFTETVYWNAAVKTDSRGKATVSFNLSDSVTSFRVVADAFTKEGALGSATSEIESRQPFSMESKVPLQVTGGDVIQLPVVLINGTDRDLRDANIKSASAAGFKVASTVESRTLLRSKERARRIVEIGIAQDFKGPVDLTLQGAAGGYSDTVRRKLDVQPLGYPYERFTGGLLESGGSSSFEFTIPAEVVPGSISSRVVVYPTPLSNMTEALQALLQQPHGCFEQTSSTSYPIVMAQQYFLTHSGIEPAIIEKAKDLLDVSYKRLTGFEAPSRGFEWYGHNPGHEALTAYGLLQFTDMSQVRSIDNAMFQRTREWLLGRRDGDGGFKRSASGYGFGGNSKDTTDAYITWALVEAGETDLAKEIASLSKSAGSSKDSYLIALAANALYKAGNPDEARRLMTRLAEAQGPAGRVDGGLKSITYSGGESLAMETTALTTLAWLHDPAYTANVEKAIRWMAESNKDGRFGSTQATVLALRALVAYDASHARVKAPGRLLLTVDGNGVGSPVAFTADTEGALVLPSFGSTLSPGKHTVALKMEDGRDMPFSIRVKYNSLLPDSAPEAQVGIEVVLRDSQIQEGEIREATVSIANKSNSELPSPVAIVGIPGGLEVRHEQLKELVKSGRIAAYELIGREVVFYWRFLEPNARFDLPLSLIAAVPGTYTGPASRAYLYYTDEYKNWALGLKVTIVPR